MIRKFRYVGKGHTMIANDEGYRIKVNEGEIFESTKNMDFLLLNGFELIGAKDVNDLNKQLKSIADDKKNLASDEERRIKEAKKTHNKEIKEIKEEFEGKAKKLEEDKLILAPQIKQAKADNLLAKEDLEAEGNELQKGGSDDASKDTSPKVVSEKFEALKEEGKKLKIKGSHLMGEDTLLEAIEELKK